MKAHREWTERHIRELIQNELKKLKPKPTLSGFTGVRTANRNIRTGVDYANERILSNLYMSDEVIHIYPDILDDLNKGRDIEYKSFYYEMEFTGAAYYNGKLVFGVMPYNGEHINVLPVDMPIYNGFTPTVNPVSLESTSDGNVYGTMYAYQDDKFFSIESQSGIELPVQEGTGRYKQYSILFFGVNPEDWFYKHTDWIDKFSNWSEYDFSKEKHYLYMEFGYLKEV